MKGSSVALFFFKKSFQKDKQNASPCSIQGMKKPKKRTTLRENTGRLLLDVGKLTFAGIVLGSSLRSELPQGILTIAGLATAIVFCLSGLFLETIEEKTDITAFKRRKRKGIYK